MNVSLIHAEGVQLTCQLYYPACPSCIDNQWLLPFEKFSNSVDIIEVEADESEVIDKDNYLITGNVILRNDSHFLSADKVKISKTDQSSEATGNVKYQDKHFFVTSENCQTRLVSSTRNYFSGSVFNALPSLCFCKCHKFIIMLISLLFFLFAHRQI